MGRAAVGLCGDGLIPDFPAVYVYDASDREQDAASDLAARLRALEIEAPFVISSVHGRVLSAALKGPRSPELHDAGADQRRAKDLGSRARRSGADAIVAVGGGRCLDVAKLAAARAGLTIIAVPTQLSHDGICSPVAVVPDETGLNQSLGALAPRAVYVSLPTLAQAPVDSVRAGLGDLLANPLALRDWALAARRGLEEIDPRAWDLSVESLEMIRPDLESDPERLAKDPAFLRRLADALILSGMAMICAGTSRPASGGEHEISHAIDASYKGRALHGAQVAFGCIVSIELYGEDGRAFRSRLGSLGLPRHPAELGLEREELVHLLLRAPDTRPGRFTILEDADLDADRARALIGRIWPDE
jgi:glycerol-1-phosphate dehydrogenase [NAD(P)+]